VRGHVLGIAVEMDNRAQRRALRRGGDEPPMQFGTVATGERLPKPAQRRAGLGFRRMFDSPFIFCVQRQCAMNALSVRQVHFKQKSPESCWHIIRLAATWARSPTKWKAHDHKDCDENHTDLWKQCKPVSEGRRDRERKEKPAEYKNQCGNE
jgi:hypothetical protein